MLVTDSSGTIHEVSLREGRTLRSFKLAGQVPARPDGALVVSPDGSHFAGIGTEGDLRIWNRADGSLAHVFKGPVGGPPVFSPDGATVAVSGSRGPAEEGGLTFVSVATGAITRELSAPLPIVLVAISPDGSQVAAMDFLWSVHLYAAGARRPTKTFAPLGARPSGDVGFMARPEVLRYSADGARLAVGAGVLKIVRLSDLSASGPVKAPGRVLDPGLHRIFSVDRSHLAPPLQAADVTTGARAWQAGGPSFRRHRGARRDADRPRSADPGGRVLARRAAPRVGRRGPQRAAVAPR